MLRSVFVIAIILFGLRQSLKGPFFALLFYLWLAYFRPETWLWTDFVSQLNLSLIIGVLVLGSTLLSGRKLALGFGPTLLLLFLLHSLFTTLMSPEFAWSWRYWQDFAKSTIISFLIVTLVDDEKKLRLTFLVIAFSLGLEQVKQGWAQMLLNPGATNANSHAVLGDNNGVAVGMFMLVPVVVALARTSSNRMEKLALRFSTIGLVYRGISTFSRGGFLASAALGLHYLLRARRKFVAIAGVVAVCLLIVPIMSDEYWARMNTINSATENEEFANETSGGRVHFWETAIVMANANPFTGIGHNAYNIVYNQYDTSNGEYGLGRAVHSSWFSILAEHGYPGMLLYLLILANAFVACRRARSLAKKDSQLQNLGTYAVAIEGALVAFMVGGTFVSFQYTEMLWHTLALSMVVQRIVAARTVAATVAPAAPVINSFMTVPVRGVTPGRRPARV